MDHDRVEGAAKTAGGKIEKTAGKVLGDKKMETEGQAKEASGKVQNTVGGIKDKVREMANEKK